MTPYKLFGYWGEMMYQAMHTHRRLEAIYREHLLTDQEYQDYQWARYYVQVARAALKTAEEDCLKKKGDPHHLEAWLDNVSEQVDKANTHASALPRPTPRQVTS